MTKEQIVTQKLKRFRVWDSARSKMILPNTDAANFVVIRLDGEVTETSFDASDGPVHGVLQQYTTVPDKFGREICEGDIISYHGQIGVVEFACGLFRVAWPDQTDDDLAYMITADMEILGVKNIKNEL